MSKVIELDGYEFTIKCKEWNNMKERFDDYEKRKLHVRPEPDTKAPNCRPLSSFCDVSDIKAKSEREKPEYLKIEVRKDLIPGNAKLVECYVTEKEVIVCGFPDNDDESHNCDQMGCSTLNHVIHRFSLDDSYERKFNDSH